MLSRWIGEDRHAARPPGSTVRDKAAESDRSRLPASIPRLLRHGRADLPVLAAALGVGLAAALVWAASFGSHLAPWVLAPWLALCQWWTANTLAHIHLHRPLWRRRALNRSFDLYLSLLMGLPQSLWRARHLWHHAGEPAMGPSPVPWRRLLPELAALGALVLLVIAKGEPPLWAGAAAGWLSGLGLCGLQGWAEHHDGRGGAVEEGLSCYAGWYNRLWFNDGYHREHHRRPGRHWRRLPEERLDAALASPWPPFLRPFAALAGGGAQKRAALVCRLLDGLETLVLGRPRLQAWLLRCHGRALDRVLADAGLSLAEVRSALVVGGGLFPRSVLLLRERAPATTVTVLDGDLRHLDIARAWLRRQGIADGGLRFLQAEYPVGRQRFAIDRDLGLAIFPLAFHGDRDRLYREPPASITLVHDWAWRRRGEAGRLVAPFLLKRLNLVRRATRRDPAGGAAAAPGSGDPSVGPVL